MLVAGKIDARQASTLSKAANFPTMDVLRAASALREASAPPSPDAKTPKEIEQDRVYGTPAKPEEYRIQWKAPGDPTPLSPEMRKFDATVRGWMADAGLSREHGNSVVSIISRLLQHTHAMTPQEIETYKDQETEKLEQLFGGPEKLAAQLEPARQMINELEKRRPGLKDFIRAHGDHALFVAKLIQAAKIYHARKGR